VSVVVVSVEVCNAPIEASSLELLHSMAVHYRCQFTFRVRSPCKWSNVKTYNTSVNSSELSLQPLHCQPGSIWQWFMTPTKRAMETQSQTSSLRECQNSCLRRAIGVQVSPLELRTSARLRAQPP
jgi:hypothetical protein